MICGSTSIATYGRHAEHLDLKLKLYSCLIKTVFCPGFQKGRVPSEKGTFSVVNGPSKGHN